MSSESIADWRGGVRGLLSREISIPITAGFGQNPTKLLGRGSRVLVPARPWAPLSIPISLKSCRGRLTDAEAFPEPFRSDDQGDMFKLDCTTPSVFDARNQYADNYFGLPVVVR